MHTPRPTARAAALLLALLGVAASLGVTAQPRSGDNPYIKRVRERNYTLTVDINARSFQQVLTETPPTIDRWNFQNAAVVFPLIPETASSTMAPVEDVVSELQFDGRTVDEEPDVLDGYPLGTRLGKWVISESQVNGRKMTLQVSIPMTTGRTEFNDRAAERLDWPKGWPEEARVALERKGWQWGIEQAVNGRPFDLARADALILEWTGGNDIRQLKPVVAAKFLTGKVVEHIQPTGEGLATARTGLIEGIDLQGSVPALMSGKGSPFDITCALALIFRRAGIPSRVVIGYDVAGAKDKGRYLKENSRGRPTIRPWVEFALYDEDKDLLFWVPVDPVYIRKKTSNRMQDNYWNKPMRYFGSHDELDTVCPFAFHFHPPTTVRAYGSPGFWGWLVMPAPPERAFQELSFRAATTPTRGGQRPRGE